jgi:hypothetical protein
VRIVGDWEDRAVIDTWSDGAGETCISQSLRGRARYRSPVYRWVVDQLPSARGDAHARSYTMTHHVISAVMMAGIGAFAIVIALEELLS